MGLEAAIKFLYEQRAKQLGIDVEFDVVIERRDEDEMDSHKSA